MQRVISRQFYPSSGVMVIVVVGSGPEYLIPSRPIGWHNDTVHAILQPVVVVVVVVVVIVIVVVVVEQCGSYRKQASSSSSRGSKGRQTDRQAGRQAGRSGLLAGKSREVTEVGRSPWSGVCSGMVREFTRWIFAPSQSASQSASHANQPASQPASNPPNHPVNQPASQPATWRKHEKPREELRAISIAFSITFVVPKGRPLIRENTERTWRAMGYGAGIKIRRRESF
ncbi:hypothetical protein M0804_008344 [Polistes exclamans]|nr:hypothetical protein M0804_008344 [Polistes exclamans]